MALFATSRSGKRRRCTRSSVLRVAMKLSAIALCPERFRSFPSKERCRSLRGACRTRSPCTLGAAIGMMHESCGWLAPPYRHLQGVDHEFRLHVRGHRPPDDLARVGIQDEGHVEEAFLRRYVGDVRQPDLIGLSGNELPAKQIRCGSSPWVAAGGFTLLAAHATPKPRDPH